MCPCFVLFFMFCPCCIDDLPCMEEDECFGIFSYKPVRMLVDYETYVEARDRNYDELINSGNHALVRYLCKSGTDGNKTAILQVLLLRG